LTLNLEKVYKINRFNVLKEVKKEVKVKEKWRVEGGMIYGSAPPRKDEGERDRLRSPLS
jgi:hypothetical protein